jgi:hypothetical protein
MAVASITEYARVKLVSGPGGAVAQCAEGPPIATQNIDFSGGATPSAALNAKTKMIRINVDAICARKWGSAPTATTTDERMSAEQTEYVGVPPDHGDGTNGTVAYKIGFITRT